MLNALEESQNEYAVIMKVVAHDLLKPFSGMISAADLMLLDDDLNDGNVEC